VSEITLEELSRRLGELAVLDVRGAGEYEGSLGAPCDPRQGHIPGALHLDIEELARLGAKDLHARLGLQDGAEVAVYCHSGARSALAVEILGRLGYAARNYAGSWHEWSRSELPLQSGPRS
jgi:thiosulfate/3-mercaptopyruvate sulfurtransferase